MARDHGDGTVFWDAGKDAFTIRVPVGKGKKLTGTAKTKAEALIWLRKLRVLAEKRRAAADNQDVPDTVAAYLHFWLRAKRQAGLRLKTDEFYERHIEKHLIPYLGHVPLRELTAFNIIESYDAMGLAGITKSDQGGAHATLSSALTHAVEIRALPHNPIYKVRKPRGEKHRATTLSGEQLLQLEAASLTSWYGPLFSVALRAGAREGELLALHWDAVDFKARTIRIEWTLTEVKGVIKGRFEVKSERSKRTLPLDETAMGALRRQREKLMAAGLAACPIVFPTDEGNYVHKKTALTRLAEACAKAGVPRITFHEQRHTHGTLLMRAGENPKAVSERLGHSQVGITLDLYTHVHLDEAREVSDRFGAALKAAGAPLTPIKP